MIYAAYVLIPKTFLEMVGISVGLPRNRDNARENENTKDGEPPR